MILMGLLFGACQVDVEEIGPKYRNFQLRVDIEEIGNGSKLPTRATVPAVAGETNVNSLYLLFFGYSEDGSGKFVQSYQIAAPPAPGTNVKIEMGTGLGSQLSYSEDYSILAFANLSESQISTLLGGLSAAKTESDVIREQLISTAAGSPIQQSSIPMSGQVSKKKDQDLIALRLTRMVSRFDVQNTLKTYYDLVSVSVFGAADKTAVWGNAVTSGITHTARYMGVSGAPLEEVVGGLYAFENFEGDPLTNRSNTTGLVIGLKAKTGAPVGAPGATMYYRVDVCPEDGAQNLKRNHVYKVSIRGVVGAGEANETDAWNNTENELDVTINNWNLDDEGMILTDGQSTMAVPVKLIKFGPEAETREYSIFTLGQGTLELSKTNLPAGLSVVLEGNVMKVSATALPGEEERSGTFELAYGGLRGTVEVIQSPKDDKFLTLSKSTLPLFTSRDVTSGSPITVSASHNWTAKIYNTTPDASNPGFSFSSTGVVTELADVASGETFTIHTTGTNPQDDIRRSFVLVSLKDYPEYRQVIVLQQNTKTSIRISPTATEVGKVRFSPLGTPYTGGSPGDSYEFSVEPGYENGAMIPWGAKLIGEDAQYFNLSVIQSGSVQRFTISAKGTETEASLRHMNLAGRDLDKVSLIAYVGAVDDPSDPDSRVEIPVMHDQLTFNLVRVSSLDRVPVKGAKVGGVYTDYVEYKVEIPASLKWTAEIVAQTHPDNASNTLPYRRHEGYLIDGNGQKVAGTTLSGQSSSVTLRVGFDKIYYPMIHWSNDESSVDCNIPGVQVKISVDGVGIEAESVVVVQQPLEPMDLNIADMQSSSHGYGSLNGTTNHFSSYTDAMVNAASFGPSGVVRTKAPVTRAGLHVINPTTYSDYTNYPINPLRNYVQAGANNYNYHNGAFIAIENWRKATEGMVFFTMDSGTSGLLSNSNSSLKKLKYQEGATNNAASCHLTNTHVDRRVMKYLMNGPFVTIPQANMFDFNFYVDGVRHTVNRSSLVDNNPHAVIIMHEENYANNVLFSIDPKERVIFLGECQALGEGTWTNARKIGFRRNLIALTLNAAMYGTHFLDLLCEDAEKPLYLPYGTTPIAQ